MATLPTFDADNFPKDPNITNPNWTLTPETQFVYEGYELENGEYVLSEIITVTVTEKGRKIDGVNTVAVTDVVVDAETGELLESTTDFYAQDNDGNIWYFGEKTREFEDGHPAGKEGAWIAGIHDASPGIIMLADPGSFINQTYSQEDAPGVAQDQGTVQSVTATTPTFATLDYLHEGESAALNIHETTLLDPAVSENKYYVDGVLAATVNNEDGSVELLVSVTPDFDDAEAAGHGHGKHGELLFT